MKQIVNSELFSNARVKKIQQDPGYPLRSSVKYRPNQFYFMFVRYLAFSAIYCVVAIDL